MSANTSFTYDHIVTDSAGNRWLARDVVVGPGGLVTAEAATQNRMDNGSFPAPIEMWFFSPANVQFLKTAITVEVRQK